MSVPYPDMELFRKAQAFARGLSSDDRPATEFIDANFGLCRMVAKWFFTPTTGLDQDDVLQVGRLGLFQALRTFEEHRGVCFSTYAVRCIQQHISRALSRHAFTIRIPDEIQAQVGMAKQIADRLYLEMGIHATAEEISEAWGGKQTPEEVAQLLTYPVADFCLDNPVGEKFDTFSDILEAEDDTWIRDGVIAITQLLHHLPPREEYVIRRRFNLHPDHDIPATAEQIAKELGVSKQNVGILERKAVFRLKCLVTGRTIQVNELGAIASGKMGVPGQEPFDEYYHHNHVLKGCTTSSQDLERRKSRYREQRLRRNQGIRDRGCSASP